MEDVTLLRGNVHSDSILLRPLCGNWYYLMCCEICSLPRGIFYIYRSAGGHNHGLGFFFRRVDPGKYTWLFGT